MKYTLKLCAVLMVVWCNIAFAGSFTDNGNGIVTDNMTGLIWQKQDDGITRTWGQGLSYCEALILDNFSDWRLPNIKELSSLVDDSRYSPTINPVFTNAKSGWYWSSTTHAYSTGSAWFVSFEIGDTNGIYKENGNYVRCVR